MPEEFAHEGLAKPHHLLVALAFRIEIGAALAAAHRQRGQRVLEHLLEGEEFEHAQRDGRMETQPALVRPDGAVHLHAAAAVDLHLAVAVGPRHAEHDDPFRLGHPLQNLGLLVLRVFFDERPNRLGHFRHRLMEFRFGGIPLLQRRQETG